MFPLNVGQHGINIRKKKLTRTGGIAFALEISVGILVMSPS